MAPTTASQIAATINDRHAPKCATEDESAISAPPSAKAAGISTPVIIHAVSIERRHVPSPLAQPIPFRVEGDSIRPWDGQNLSDESGLRPVARTASNSRMQRGGARAPLRFCDRVGRFPCRTSVLPNQPSQKRRLHRGGSATTLRSRDTGGAHGRSPGDEGLPRKPRAKPRKGATTGEGRKSRRSPGGAA